jgi:hypothetical protein
MLLTLETNMNKLLSKFALSCNLRHYSKGPTEIDDDEEQEKRRRKPPKVGRCMLTLD